MHVDFALDALHEDLDEFSELVRSAGVTILEVVTTSKRAPEAKYFIGKGKADEIAAMVHAHKADVVIFNHTLTPAQERLFSCRVINRIGLILDIFAQRARTFEGKLQVELAQLNHLSTRLIRGWTHLERQKGGIGLRGPGETQLESDRRMIRARIKNISMRLEKVRSQRHQGRRSRLRAAISTVSLVGYTNAGKSTLFNQMTDANVYEADQLFATLDPTLRQIKVPNIGDAILVDTVGFIRHLPHELIEAFRATLEETQQAALLLHVQDVADSEQRTHAAQVQSVLTEIGANEVPQLQVFNKIDLISDFEPHIKRNDLGIVDKVWVSARTGAGMDLLMEAIAERLAGETVYKMIQLRPDQGKLRAHLYAKNCVIDERHDEDGVCYLYVKLPRKDFEALSGLLS